MKSNSEPSPTLTGVAGLVPKYQYRRKSAIVRRRAYRGSRGHLLGAGMAIVTVVRRLFCASIVFLLLAPDCALAQDSRPANAQPCKLNRLASLDLLQLPTGRFAVPVTISGTSFNFLVGLEGGSAITDAVATQFNLRRGSTFGWRGPAIFLMGLPVSESAVVPDFQIGSVHAAQIQMYVAGTMITGHTLTFPEGDAVGGVLGTSLFRNFGIEFDFKGKKLNLYAPSTCGLGTVFWADSAVSLPFELDQVGNVIFHMQLDGKDLTVAPDPSVTQATMGTAAAESIFGIKDGTPGFQPDPAGKGQNYRYPFKTLSLGGLTIGNPAITIYPEKPSQRCQGKRSGDRYCFGGADLQIGTAELRALQIFFSLKEGLLYATGADAHL